MLITPEAAEQWKKEQREKDGMYDYWAKFIRKEAVEGFVEWLHQDGYVSHEMARNVEQYLSSLSKGGKKDE